MPVYVDSMAAGYGRMVMCHMVADTTVELLAMADRIGVDRKWIQDAGTHREHFDITKSKRALAIQAGAIPVTMRELSRVLVTKRKAVLREADPLSSPVRGTDKGDL